MTDGKSEAKRRVRDHCARQIRVLLAHRNMSGAELARRAGMKQQALSRRMTGDTAFDIDDLAVIANALGIEVSDLFKGIISPEEKKSTSSDGGQATAAKLRVTKQPAATTVRPTSDRPRAGRPVGRSAGAVAPPTLRRPVRL